MSTRRIGVAERRARFGVRHLLAAPLPAADPLAVADAVVALHATDPATVHLSALARMAGSVADVERALYEDRTLLRMLGMRRTVFVLPVDVAPAVQAAVAGTIAARSRASLVKDLTAAGVASAAAWLADVEASALAALVARGSAFATELAADEPRLRTTVGGLSGKSYDTPQTITSRVLFLLAADGHIVRGRPRGSWLSTQYSWAPVASWLSAGLELPDPAQARRELVRRWLVAFGPAPEPDLRWWTGLGARELRPALAAIGAVTVGLDDGREGLLLPDDLDPVPAPEPWAALLPALDPTPMGWHDRAWLLGEHAPLLVDRTGNVGATVWWDGRVVGGWAQRATGELVVELLEDVGADARSAVDAAAARLGTHLAGAVVTPRFPSPLDKRLAGRPSPPARTAAAPDVQ